MRLKNKILIEGDTLTILENTELDTLQSLLDSHDWYYMMSDDPRVYDRGEAQSKEINRLVKSLGEEGKALYNAKYKEIFGKEPLMEDSVMYGDSDGDYDSDMESRVQAEEYYDKGLQAYSEGDLLKAERLYNAALKAGAWLGWTEKDLPPYEEMTKSINEAKEKKDLAEKKKAEKTNYGHKDMSDVDMVNPYELKKGIRIEMVDTDDYEKAMDKAVKKLKKDPMHYSNLIANAKETKGKRADVPTEVKDKKLNKVSDKLKDKANEMEVSKKDATKKNANDTLNKKEKASGKPKGVKEMTMTPKKSKGMKSMDVPGKEKKVSLKESFNLWEAFKKNILR